MPAPDSLPTPSPAPLDPPLAPSIRRDWSRLVQSLFESGATDSDAVERLAASGDARLAWLLSDLLRFLPPESSGEAQVLAAYERLTGVDPRRATPRENAWLSLTDDLIARDLQAPPGYRELKWELFGAIEPAWEPFFSDPDAELDWRLVTWGGVLIDDRPAGSREPCENGCIPALDDPLFTEASAGSWYADEGLVFGIVVGEEAAAFPKHIMEVHEMVNLTLGGRRLGVPYCTLCASAQAYFTDAGPAESPPLVLRTSGLLARSNKVMYELATHSVLDTFTGRALSGPLHDARVTLEATTVVVSTWGEWKRAHPRSRIVAQDGGVGRDYPLDPLHGRDDDGPIFPVGDVDPRLAVHARVVGVISPDGHPIGFAVAEAREALAAGRRVFAHGVELHADGGGFRACDQAGRDLPTHESFWFAWSQFHRGTELWLPHAR